MISARSREDPRHRVDTSKAINKTPNTIRIYACWNNILTVLRLPAFNMHCHRLLTPSCIYVFCMDSMQISGVRLCSLQHALSFSLGCERYRLLHLLHT